MILHVHQLSQSHGLTQDVAKQTAEQRARAGYVPYLVPKQFDLSVTKGDGDYSNGVINYCILTHRHNGMAELEIDLKTDPCAGFWQAGDTPFRRPRGWHVEWRRRRHVHFSRCFPRLVAERGVFFVFQGQHDRASDDNVARAPGLSRNSDTITVNGNNKLTLKQDFAFHDIQCQEMNAQRMIEAEQLSIFTKLVLQASALVPPLELTYNQKRQAHGGASIAYCTSLDMLTHSFRSC